MALCWKLFVALFALTVGLSEAQNFTNATTATTATVATPTTSVIPTSTTGGGGGGGGGGGSATTTQIAATPATAVVPTSSTSPSAGFLTYLDTRFKSSACPPAKDAKLLSKFESFFDDPKFDFKTIAPDVTRDKCQFSFNITFGPDLQMYNISEVFVDELKRINNTVDGMKLTDIKAEVRVENVTLGEFKVGADECEKICCEGAGGPITLTRTCDPSYKCRSYKLKKVEPDCTNVCKCSGVPMCKISLLVLLFGVFMDWFLK